MSNQSVVAERVPLKVRRGAKALITAGDRLLLVKETHDDGSPFWTLPGGGVEPGETDTDALHREIAEELLCQVDITEKRTAVWYAHSSTEKLSLYVIYDCTLQSRPVPNPIEGVFDYRWLKPDEMAPSTIQQVRYLRDRQSLHRDNNSQL